jgi:hypothetical protein
MSPFEEKKLGSKQKVASLLEDSILFKMLQTGE